MKRMNSSNQNKSKDPKYLVYSPDDDISSDEEEHVDGDSTDEKDDDEAYIGSFH